MVPVPYGLETGPMFASLSPPEIQRSALAALGAVSRGFRLTGVPIIARIESGRIAQSVEQGAKSRLNLLKMRLF